jgi:hypothetical protein
MLEPRSDPTNQPSPAEPPPKRAVPLYPPPSPSRAPEASPAPPGSPVFQNLVWQGKIFPAFWTVASVLSLTVNVILIVILVIAGRELFAIKSLVNDQLIGGLHSNFVKMDEANIRTTIQVNDTIQVKDTIQVNDTIPVVFDLPLQQNTTVTLIADTPVRNATIYLNGQAVPLNLVLRRGTQLGIALDLIVPVNQTVPVQLTVPVDLQVPVSLSVPVDIPLRETELHQPFVGLQNVVAPYQELLTGLPDSWGETPLCNPLMDLFCDWFLDTK